MVENAPVGIAAGPRMQAIWEDGPFEPQVEILPALLTLVIVGLVTAYRYVHPLAKLPLVMEICSMEANRLMGTSDVCLRDSKPTPTSPYMHQLELNCPAACDNVELPWLMRVPIPPVTGRA
jgi:hypothetical protein